MKFPQTRRIVQGRRESREHFTRAIGELGILGLRAIDDLDFENRTAYVRGVLVMILDKVDVLRELK